MKKSDWDAREDRKAITRSDNAAARKLRSPKEQIEHLDKIFGVGLGAKKERAKLARIQQ